MKSKNSEGAPQNGVCSECQTGVLRLQYLTYFTWLNGELITVPNFPAWVCDVCGRRDYDDRAVLWLNTLLAPEAGRRLSPRRRPGVIGADQPQT
ncbi:MAG: YgiT-type zinc finger protein [Anaerolineales bacterium]|nr:YgiT-type zinc finger protein [Anaerolineales bacterium]